VKENNGPTAGDELTSWEVCVSMIVSFVLSRKAMVIFFEQLQQLNDFVKKGRKGNQPEDFKEKGPKIVIY